MNLFTLHGDAAAEDRCDFGRRDEVTAGAEFLRAGAVVTETRLVEGQRHEALEADPAAGFAR